MALVSREKKEKEKIYIWCLCMQRRKKEGGSLAVTIQPTDHHHPHQAKSGTRRILFGLLDPGDSHPSTETLSTFVGEEVGRRRKKEEPRRIYIHTHSRQVGWKHPCKEPRERAASNGHPKRDGRIQRPSLPPTNAREKREGNKRREREREHRRSL